MDTIYRTFKGVNIFVEHGKKSANDFIVKYQEPGKRTRTPKHIHLVVDLFAKHTWNPSLTNDFIDHIINNIILVVPPINTYPPMLKVFSPNHMSRFSELNRYGEYSVEFLLIVTELIMIQEKTNYPNGTMNLNLFRKLRV